MASLLMVFVSLLVYTAFLLPGINDLECGEDYDTEFLAWKVGLDSTGVTAYNAALLIQNDDARIADFKKITTTLTYPVCKGTIPTGKTHQRAYQLLATFMPLLVLIPLLWLAFKQSGNIGMFPAIALALIIRELIPGDGIIDWLVMVIGITIACIPIPVGGLLAALSHVGALAIWPTMILAYSASAGAADSALHPALEQVFEFVVWVMPIGILIFLPLRWRMQE